MLSCCFWRAASLNGALKTMIPSEKASAQLQERADDGVFEDIAVIKQQPLYSLLPDAAVPLQLVNPSRMTVGSLPVYVAHELNKNKLLTQC